MTLQEIILNSTDGLGSFPVLEIGCRELGLPLHEFCEQFAVEVARSFHSGTLNWEDGDGAMNSLYYSFVYEHDQSAFPEIAYSVFSAFDDGEYPNPGDSAGFDPRLHTREIIAGLIAKIGP